MVGVEEGLREGGGYSSAVGLTGGGEGGMYGIMAVAGYKEWVDEDRCGGSGEVG